MKNAPYNVRAIAAKAIYQVLDQGQSLSNVLPELNRSLSDKDKPLLQELSFGVLRTLPLLEWCIQQLMAKVMTGKQRPLHYLLMVGIYQLVYTRIPPHAALAETVNGAVALKKPQLKGLINGVLRQFQRQQDDLLQRVQNVRNHLLHPEWLLKRLQHAYPEQWREIIEANNQKPPMWLRVNRNHHSRADYLSLLAEAGITAFPHETYPDAIRLETPLGVQQLPGFDQGWVTVQDASAQHCVDLLAPEDHDVILDLCCAPGGKTTHILEAAPKAQVLAVDIDEGRLARVRENLHRLSQQAEVRCGDGRDPHAWAGERQFDRILLDAPCSATGVIRRHPDIKWLRRDADIAELAALQREILQAVWPRLKSGGTMVYATCSVLPEENALQIAQFLASTPDAKLEDTGTPAHPGLQNLPAPQQGDGFFYAKLIKV
ncbi:16S rRNA (cytosine(967)-C(5))-methyltransferase RsmB [Enterobacillus tribolii]|uniref:Ribosomal RNA small subunit methyltransferase B n=1 Tax=Enterobacillus tribolii TaxID=1487935 RepID=A0A370Q5Z3_9GAMM|nr:16S rRNA (cytosine(967)-C(5))-methyltransferase RsmB [Enterobacillus tribolii]MBW7984996.1 16S rRNA (cytosine(967)-C(5))-methyltransferase RsmB [Enterobacillus tribolii]RDK83739.1 16S rRNA m(5)C-967 methyltransferase [Enterobacillus tribolii]